MTHSVLDVVVVGAGHAGLSVSYNLKKQGLNHLVFERGTGWLKKLQCLTANTKNSYAAIHLLL